jgi:hypothetical protein
VIQDGLVGWVGSGGINLACHAFARQVAVFRINFLVNRRGYALEILRRGKSETAKQNAAVLV